MYTRHGHHISGTDTENPPKSRARCGGPGLCNVCSVDAAQAQKNNDSNNPEGD